MNAAGLIILSLGIILIIIGVKGSQHRVLQSLKGVASVGGGNKKTTAPVQQLQGTGKVHFA